jgi:ferric-dicitrate binding protein FerR (iron transport regulator)
MNGTIKRKIQNYFNGQLSDTEEAEIVKWLNLCEENRQYFFTIKDQLDPQKINHPLLESSFNELKSKLLISQQFNSGILGQLKSFRLNFLRFAAIFLVALCTGFLLAYILIENKKQKSETVWFETHVPRGEKSQLLLPDGSKVWLNSESKISYPSNFMDGNRQIKLKGEAYFEVAKSEGKSFTVNTNDYDIRVLGTKFNVMAYSDFGRTETSLIEGKIEIQKGIETFSVIPGQKLIYTNNHFSIEETNTKQTSKWKDDIFDFDQITFKELIVRLERWYDVDIVIISPELNGILYSGIFKNEETIWQILSTLQLSHPVLYSRVGFRKFEIKMAR